MVLSVCSVVETSERREVTREKDNTTGDETYVSGCCEAEDLKALVARVLHIGAVVVREGNNRAAEAVGEHLLLRLHFRLLLVLQVVAARRLHRKAARPTARRRCYLLFVLCRLISACFGRLGHCGGWCGGRGRSGGRVEAKSWVAREHFNHWLRLHLSDLRHKNF